MILVLTNRAHEQSTDPVVDWLIRHQAPFLRLDLMSVLEGQVSLRYEEDGRVIVDGRDLSTEVKVVFYRRFLHNVPLPDDQRTAQRRERLGADLRREADVLFQRVFSCLRHAQWFPDYEAAKQAGNKLSMSALARKAGLTVPKTLVCNRRSDLLRFCAGQEDGVICKPVDFCGYYFHEDQSYTTYTTLVDEKFLDRVPERFFPTLFQAAVKRDYELRIFYLDGDFYPTAIYANTYGEDLADIKLLVGQRTTHKLPYVLPTTLTRQLSKFMRAAGLTTGSIDVIRDREGSYHFIEVNPLGQFLGPGRKCNYHIENKIAQWLIQKNQSANRPAHSPKKHSASYPSPIGN